MIDTLFHSLGAIYTYAILFMGSVGDTLIGLNLFIHGEVFFLSGAHLAQMGYLNIFMVYGTLVLGAISGDNISYFLGKRFKISYKKDAKIFSLKNYNAVKKLFEKHGDKAIFLSKLLGPVSWVTPFFSGNLNYNYRRFVIYNFIGILVGIGQFMILGYFGSFVLSTYFYSGLVIAFFFLLSVGSYKYFKKILPSPLKWQYVTLKIIVIIAISYFMSLSLFYFALYPRALEKKTQEVPVYHTVEEVFLKQKIKYVYADKYLKNDEQPINILIVTNKLPEDIFNKIGWKKKLLFSQDQMSFSLFLRQLFVTLELPVVDFFLGESFQDYVFQSKSQSSINQAQIRLWELAALNDGRRVYAGSVSQNDGWRFSIIQLVPTIVHDIEREIDQARTQIKNLLKNAYPKMEFEYLSLAPSTLGQDQNIRKDYVSDGQAVIIFLP